MKDIPQWVLWKLEERDGKYTKVPYQINGKRADSTRKETWNIFEDALAAYDSSIHEGLGFVLTKDAGIVAVDFDHVLYDYYSAVDGCNFGKRWLEGVLDEIQDFKSYAEISQSGEGAHVFCKGTLPKAGRKKDNREMYCENRFFAITGDHIENTPKNLNEAQDCVTDYYEMWFEENQVIESVTTDLKSPELSNEDIVRLASAARNNEKFLKLHSGDIRDYHSSSEADFAYCRILAFYTQNKKQIDEIYRSSGLYNKKWDRRGKYTLEKVVTGLTEVYTGKNNTSFDINPEASDEIKQMTEAEINLLKTNFAQRRLECKLPEEHFITQFVTYADRMTDGYQDYKILAGFWLLSSLTQRKPYIDLATSADGIFLNVWAQFLGFSSISRKTTVLDIARKFFAYAQGEPLTDTDYSLEGYLETLAETPVLAMINDEVSTVFQKMNQKYNAGYNEFECKLYDCNSQNKRLASGGKKEPKTYSVKDPYITKLYGTTFVKYKRSMSIPDFDSGFGFRFLYAPPTYEFEQRPPRLRTAEDIEERGKMEIRTAQLYDLFAHSPSFAMNVSQDAFDYYIKTDFEIQKEILHKSNQELLGQAWSRYSIYILKLAGLIEIGKKPVSQTITLESVKIAASIILNYFLPTLCDVYNLLAVDPQNNKIDKIIEALKDFRGIASHSLLLRKTRLESKEFRSLIETTIESGQVEKIIEKNPKNGKVTTYYHYIDCEETVFENPSSPNSQIHTIPKFTCTNNSVGINENLDLFTQLEGMRLDTQITQSKIIQTHTDSRAKNTLCEPGNLENLGISVNLDSNEDIEKISKGSKESLEDASFTSKVVSAEEAARILEEEGI